MEHETLIFKNLLKPLWLKPFLNNDLILLIDIPSKVQKTPVKTYKQNT